MGDKRIIPQPPARRRREQEMLGEATPGLAICLWQYVRHLRDWLDCDARQREGLFHTSLRPWVIEKRGQARAEGEGIEDALGVVESVTRSPVEAGASEVADACEQIARWCAARGYAESAIQFAEAAALIDPEEARRANLAGKLTRDAADHFRAEVWLERGIGLARRRKDWVEYTRGHLGAGILYMELGREARARGHLHTASIIALREGREWLAAEAQHDLFRFMTVRGSLAGAELHARRALSWYPKHHHRIPYFAADVAFLLVCQRHYSGAVAILRPFLRKIKPPESVLGFGLFVRALAAAGRRAEFERARTKLLALLEQHHEYEAAARWHLAYAERAVGQWEQATENAELAHSLARARGDRETAGLAAELLTALAERAPVAGEIRRTDKNYVELVRRLASRVAAWSPTRRGRLPSRSREEWAA